MSRSSTTPTLLLALALSTIAVSGAKAQVPLSPRSVGMGTAMIAAARGQHAVFLNPANLALPESPRWSVALVGVSAAAVLEGIELNDAADLIQYDDLSDAEKDRLFARVPAEGVRLDVDLRAPVASVQVGPFGFGVAYLMLGGHTVSRDLVDLLLYGYEEGRTDYSVNDTRGDRASLWDLAAAYGTATGPVSWGVTGHLLVGGTLVRTFMTEPRIDLVGQDIDVDYYGLRSQGGTGVSLDLGVAYQLRRNLTLSGAVTSAYSRLSWSDNLRLRRLELSREDFDNGEGLQGLINRYEGSERDLTPDDAALFEGDPESFLRQDAQLPTTANVGVAWQPAPRTDLVASYSDDLTSGRLGGDWTRRLGAGVQQGFWMAAVRAGVATDLTGQSMITGGLSIGPVDLGLARLSGDDDGTSRSGWIGVFGLETQVH